MAVSEEVKKIVEEFIQEPRLKEKTEKMGEGLLLGASLADEANEKSNETTSIALSIQEKYKEQILVHDLDPNKDPELVELRDGYDTASERIDYFEQKTTEQLMQSSQELANTLNTLVPKRFIFGGQLEKLKEALSNALSQYISIVFIGDSITWGMTLLNNGTINPRSANLSDARDNFNSDSFVNLFKRYVGEKYMDAAVPLLSNWQSSPSGESIVEFKKQYKIFPIGGDFEVSYSGNYSPAPMTVKSPSSLLGFQHNFYGYPNQDGVMTIEFLFTGKEFTVSYDSVLSGMDYELLVDGVSQGIFSTAPKTTGEVVGYDRRRKHTFNYVKDKKIKIKTIKTTYQDLQVFRIGGLIIDKVVKISNQGIIGTSALDYKKNNLITNNALKSDDSYIFVQFGTNDRITKIDLINGYNEYKKNLSELIDYIHENREIILMNANQVLNENSETYSFSMQDVKNTAYRVAKEKNIDFIDNYSVFGENEVLDYTEDGTHPNAVGHKVYFRNIINSIESN